MQLSKSYALLAALAAAPTALAHTIFTEFYVDGVSNGPGTCVRTRHDGYKASFPLEDLSSNDVACNVNGEEGLQRVCGAKAGSTMTFEFHSYGNDKSKPILDPGHHGPCAVYMKKVDSAINDAGHGDGWFKVWDMGYEDGQWCTNHMIDDGGFISVKIPQLARGYYLVRPELLALHSQKHPQFYTGCAQVFLESDGDLGPVETISIPGDDWVKADDDSVMWNIYYGADPNDYPTPGPAVASLKSGARKSSNTEQTEGLLPEGCIVENGDFCAFEVPDYDDETSCWASQQNCWDQQAQCWDSIPATGGKGCDAMNEKCDNLNALCKAKSWVGPPDAGKTLYHAASTLSADPKMYSTRGGSIEQQAAEPTSAVQAELVTSAAAAETPTPTAKPVEDIKESEDEEAPAASPKPSTPAPAAPVSSAAPQEDAPKPTARPDGPLVVTEVVHHTVIEWQTVWVK